MLVVSQYVYHQLQYVKSFIQRMLTTNGASNKCNVSLPQKAEEPAPQLARREVIKIRQTIIYDEDDVSARYLFQFSR